MSLLASNFREKVSKLKDYKMKVETEFPVGYSTGFLSFDFMNGSVVHAQKEGEPIKYYSVGITDGSMVMVIGRAGCGKTTYCIQAAANIIRPYETSCIFHDDIEGGITENRKELLTGFFGDELTKRYIARNTGITAENFYERVKMVNDMKQEDRESYSYDTGLYDYVGNKIFKLEPTVYIMDSLALLTPEKYAEEDELSGQMSTTATAKANAMIFRRMIPLLKSSNIILFVINHINQKVELNMFSKTKAQVNYLKAGETLPGGNTPIYLSNLMLRFDDNTKFKEGEGFGIPGNMVDISLVKSRSARAGKSCTLVFNPETGYDIELSLLVLLKDNGKINGAGIGLYVGDRNDLKFSQKKFKEKLLNNEEFRNVVMEEVMNVLVSMVEEHDIQEEQQQISSNITTNILNKLNGIAA